MFDSRLSVSLLAFQSSIGETFFQLLVDVLGELIDPSQMIPSMGIIFVVQLLIHFETSSRFELAVVGRFASQLLDARRVDKECIVQYDEIEITVAHFTRL